LVVTGCGAASDNAPQEHRAAAQAEDDGRTLVVAMRTEPKALVGVDLNPTHIGIIPDAPWQVFHAALVHHNERELPQPQLSEALPQLNSESWKVFPDGRMETSWRLRPNLRWHDGAPIVADDFVLAVQYSKATRADRLIEVDEVSAPDARTVVVHYKMPYPDAGQFALQPLPRHIVGQALEQMEAREAFDVLPYWTTEFVGAGPYRLAEWQPGAYITGTAFTEYVKGKPRIGRIQLVWMADANTAVANLLSGVVHLATDVSVAFEQASVLRQEWAARGQPGSVMLGTARTVYLQPQFRPEYVRPAAMLELRFRQALAHGIDKQAIVDAVLDGEPGMADTLIVKEEEYYPELDRMLAKYPLDLRRSEQLIAELGFMKDGEGLFAQGGTRLAVGVQVTTNYLRDALVLADGWKRAGLEVPLQTLSATEQINQEIASTFPALRITQFGISPNPFHQFNSTTIASPATRWAGRNKGGYYEPEIDRLAELYYTSLDRHDRNRAVMQAMKLVSEQVAYFPLYYGYEVVAHTGNLVGPRAARKAQALWNVEEWSWR
jgi:peptide/nickel transport system substrate-binding protein